MTLPWLCRLAGSPSSLQRPFHVVEVIAAHAQKLAVRVLRSDGRPPPRKTRLPAAGPALSDASLWGPSLCVSLCVSLGSDRFRIFSAQAKGAFQCHEISPRVRFALSLWGHALSLCVSLGSLFGVRGLSLGVSLWGQTDLEFSPLCLLVSLWGQTDLEFSPLCLFGVRRLFGVRLFVSLGSDRFLFGVFLFGVRPI